MSMAAPRPVAAEIREAFPEIHVVTAGSHVGPGGGRNTLVQSIETTAGRDVRRRLLSDGRGFLRTSRSALFAEFSEAWVVAAHVYHVNEPSSRHARVAEWAADFSGGGCAYRRERYLEVGGYVPLPDAYNMEEVDFALRLHAKGGKVLGTPWLRVFHDTDRARHADPAVTAASIANLALLAFLRYPIHLWTIGVAQCANRIQWLIRNGRHRGILGGLADIPSRLWSNRHRRQPLPSAAVLSYFALRRRPIPAPLDAAIARADG